MNLLRSTSFSSWRRRKACRAYCRLVEFLTLPVVTTTPFEVNLYKIQAFLRRARTLCLDPRCKVRLRLLNSATSNDIGLYIRAPGFWERVNVRSFKVRSINSRQTIQDCGGIYVKPSIVVSANGNPSFHDEACHLRLHGGGLDCGRRLSIVLSRKCSHQIVGIFLKKTRPLHTRKIPNRINTPDLSIYGGLRRSDPSSVRNIKLWKQKVTREI
jgi:hypothetical protein